MLSGWSLVRFAHVLAAILWVGGQLTLSLVVRRAAVETLADDTRSELFIRMEPSRAGLVKTHRRTSQ